MSTDLGFARKLFRSGYFGPDEITCVFGVSLAPAPEDVPPIPLSKKMLGHLHSLGLGIELHGPFSMSQIYDAIGDKLVGTDSTAWRDKERKVLRGVERPNERFYRDERTASWHWRVVTKTCLPFSSDGGNDYFYQSCVLADFLKDRVFAGRVLPEKFQRAIKWTEHVDVVREHFVFESQAFYCVATNRWVSRDINQLCRGTASQSLWGMALYKEVNGEYPFSRVWEWTRSLGMGSIVDVGADCQQGAFCGHFGVGFSNPFLGARFSCCAGDLSS